MPKRKHESTECAERRHRARTQTLYFLGQKRLDEDIIKFDIRGSTGTVYNVQMQTTPAYALKLKLAKNLESKHPSPNTYLEKDSMEANISAVSDISASNILADPAPAPVTVLVPAPAPTPTPDSIIVIDESKSKNKSKKGKEKGKEEKKERKEKKRDESVYKKAVHIKCNCFDFHRRKRTCKHIYFLVERVLGGQEPGSSFLWDKALARLEKDEMAIADVTAALPPEYIHLYKAFLARNGESNTNGNSDEKTAYQVTRREWQNVECAICTEPMENEDDLEWCKKMCGNSIHKACFEKWEMHKKESTCPYCRSLMETEKNKNKKKSTKKQKLRHLQLD